MHEVSLVRSLLAQVGRIVASQGGGAVRMIRLQCGPLSGVEPALVSSAFELLRVESDFADASLSIDEVPLEALCHQCRAVFMPERFRFACPRCGSQDTDVIQGDAMILESIELEPLAERELI